jgi:hypothetical protein
MTIFRRRRCYLSISFEAVENVFIAIAFQNYAELNPVHPVNSVSTIGFQFWNLPILKNSEIVSVRFYGIYETPSRNL